MLKSYYLVGRPNRRLFDTHICQGALTPSDAPEHYITCIAALIACWQRLMLKATETHHVLIVHASGWIEGLGEDILAHICQQRWCTKGRTVAQSSSQPHDQTVQFFT